jgi:serine/threonine protein kinase
MYWLMTGQSPFLGLATEKMAERQVRDIPNPAKLNPAISDELAAIIQRMGARDPHKRFPDATALLIALQSWLPMTDWVSIAATLPILPKEPPKRLTDDQPKADRGWWARLVSRK